MSQLDNEKEYPQPAEDQVQVNVLEHEEDLAHTPKARFDFKKTIRSLGSKDAWLGDYVSQCGRPFESLTEDRIMERCLSQTYPS
jgi:hypothetical protein